MTRSHSTCTWVIVLNKGCLLGSKLASMRQLIIPTMSITTLPHIGMQMGGMKIATVCLLVRTDVIPT